MQQVAQWLEKLGMSEYVQVFADNRIDFSVLRDLSEQDLKEIGVALGDRRKLLRAISALDGAAEPSASATSPAVLDGAERRQLTVMFCDLVGLDRAFGRARSRGLARRNRHLSPLLRGVDPSAMAAFVAKYMGDGVLAYFGYPQAHEHDAERAVQSGARELGGRSAEACDRGGRALSACGSGSRPGWSLSAT